MSAAGRPTSTSALIVPVIVQPARPRFVPQSGDMSHVPRVRRSAPLRAAGRGHPEELAVVLRGPVADKDDRAAVAARYVASASSAGLLVRRLWRGAVRASIAQMSRFRRQRGRSRRRSCAPSGDQLGFWPPMFAAVGQLRAGRPRRRSSPRPAGGRCGRVVNGDARAVGRPGRIGVLRRGVGQTRLAGPVGVDRVDVELSVAGRLEGESRAVVAPGWVTVEPTREGELLAASCPIRAAITVDVGVAAACRLERDARPVWRPRRLGSRAGSPSSVARGRCRSALTRNRFDVAHVRPPPPWKTMRPFAPGKRALGRRCPADRCGRQCGHRHCCCLADHVNPLWTVTSRTVGRRM